MYGMNLNPNIEQYAVMLTMDNSDYKEIVGGIYKVKKNAEKEVRTLNDVAARATEADGDWSHRRFKLVKICYEED